METEKEEVVKIPIKGGLEFGLSCNYVVIPKKVITLNGILMVRDLLQGITGIGDDTPFDERFDGEKARSSSLEDYLIEILEKKYGLDIRICGFCHYYDIYKNSLGLERIVYSFCSRKDCPTKKRKFGEKCCFKFCQWIPREKK